MPEGHTIHRAARQQNRHFAGRVVEVTSPQGRFGQEAALLDGRVLHNVEAHGKHLFQHWDDDVVVHIHFGLFGRARLQRGPDPAEPRDTIRMRMRTPAAALDLSGLTICRLVDPEQVARVRARLGPDPLRADARPEDFVARVTRSTARIGTLVMDQSVIAGVGNVYRAEGLYLAGIHPELPGRDLDGDRVWELWGIFGRLLADGVKAGAIRTVAPEHRGLPDTGPARSRHRYVYRRSHCRVCTAPVQRWDLQGRTCYACPRCQPLD